MKITSVPTSLGLLLGSAALARADCAAATFNEGGNFFCQAVSRIQYTKVGRSASYDAVTLMDQASGACQKAPHSYGGAMAPFDEEMSIHLRGPIHLKQFAAYTLGGAKKKRDDEDVAGGSSPREDAPHAKRHALGGASGHHGHHHHLHQEKRRADEAARQEKRHDDVWVTATIDGVVQSWLNNYWPDEETPAPMPPLQSQGRAPAPAAAPAPQPVPAPAPEPQAAPAPSIYKSGKPPVVVDYSRIGYYDSASGTADGVTFLGNYGGQGSGKFTYTFGNTLSFANAAGTDGAAGATTLADTVIPSNKEVMIFSNRPCSGDCGYYQDGAVAYHGWGGSDKVWLFEFMMPHDGSTGFNADMPSLWSLNAQIPRTSQYGDCSCWKSGCGEFDIYEVLASGDNKCKSTFHFGSGAGGGSSDYFDRPVDKFIKVAVVFDSASGSTTVKLLPDSTTFPTGLSKDQVKSFIDSANALGLSTLFTLAS